MPETMPPFMPTSRERELAMAALKEIADVTLIGPFIDASAQAGVSALHFGYTGPGYPGWHWEVLLAKPAGQDEATVVEAGLLPTDDALLAPDWVPWSERLAGYRAQLDGDAEAVGAEDDADDIDDETGFGDETGSDDETDGIDDIDEDDLEPDDTELPDLDVGVDEDEADDDGVDDLESDDADDFDDDEADPGDAEEADDDGIEVDDRGL